MKHREVITKNTSNVVILDGGEIEQILMGYVEEKFGLRFASCDFDVSSEGAIKSAIFKRDVWTLESDNEYTY